MMWHKGGVYVCVCSSSPNLKSMFYFFSKLGSLIGIILQFCWFRLT